MAKRISEKELEEFFNSIKIGHKNASIPPKRISKYIDNFIDNKNRIGRALIIKTEKGYYSPNPLDPVDEEEFYQYISEEYDRANSIIEKCNIMQSNYNRIARYVINQWEESKNA